jgi:hypothetical protein
MDTNSIMGTISFINHQKQYVTIEYLSNKKKKTINGKIVEAETPGRQAKKTREPQIGDEVSFRIGPSPRGDKMIATHIEFKYNNAMDNLLRKSMEENRHTGYLKKVGDEYFVKETGSYILFPLKFSPWEKKPGDNQLNEPFFFKLEHADKPGLATAVPYNSFFLPAYLEAMKHYKAKTAVEATVTRVTPFAVFIDLFDGQLKARLPRDASEESNAMTALKPGDRLKVRISYLGHSRIVVEALR